MKGIVFNEFMDFVEAEFGIEVIDNMINKAMLASGGAYTKAGYYPHEELISMLVVLNTQTTVPIPTLVRNFGIYLFAHLISLRPDLLANLHNLFDFLDIVESIIHVDVKRLYPDAELPKLQALRNADGSYVLIYASNRRFADLAEGMILGAIQHFGAHINLVRKELPDEDNMQVVEFMLTPL